MESTSNRLTFANYDSWITVDADQAKVYGEETNEEAKEVTCWIASRDEKPFAIGVHNHNDPQLVSHVAIVVDGHDIKAENSTFRKQKPKSKLFDSVRVSQSEVRELKFGTLQTTDDDGYLEAYFSQTMGEIKVVVSRARLAIKTLRSPNKRFKPPPLEPKKIHESVKKALSHQVKFGDAKMSLTRGTMGCDVKLVEVLATFVFKYRPLAMLQANGIAPQEPTSPPAEQHAPELSFFSATSAPSRKRQISQVKQEFDDDHHGDEDQSEPEECQNDLLERLESLQNELDKIKGKISSSQKSRPSKKKVKQESRSYFTPGEIIDLT